MKIMIVDDEPIILSGIENIINNEFNVCTKIVKSFDGIDALDRLENFTPDLIITDICMPEMSGLELIEKVINKGICSRFIILTGYADFEYAKQAIQYKVLDYIVKPIDKVEFVKVLNSVYKNIEQEKLIQREISIQESMLYDIKKILKANAKENIDEVDNIINDEQLKNQAQKIITEVLNYSTEKEIKNEYSQSVSIMIDYINKNYMNDISLDDVAETVDLHPNYASSLFKKEIGTSFIQYLNSYKIKKAKSFIKENPELSLDRVAEMVGYENSSHFIKVFKKYCNTTPGEYRNKVNS